MSHLLMISLVSYALYYYYYFVVIIIIIIIIIIINRKLRENIKFLSNFLLKFPILHVRFGSVTVNCYWITKTMIHE